MSTLICKFIGKSPENDAGENRGEIWLDLLVYSAHVERGLVDEHDLVGILATEAVSPLVQVPGGTSSENDDERHIEVRYLERAMEVLSRVDAGRVDPLHLHQKTDRERIGFAIGCSASHRVDQLLPLVLPSPLPDGIRILGLRLFDGRTQSVHAVDGLLPFAGRGKCIEQLEYERIQNTLVQIAGIRLLAPVIVERILCCPPSPAYCPNGST